MSNHKLERLKASWEGHTPGPYRVSGWAGEHDEAGAQIKSKSGLVVAHTSHASDFSRGGLRDSGWAEYKANAHLFTLAPAIPDLVAALEALVEAKTCSEMISIRDGIATAALDKLVEGM
jgi:hypothetical protein